MADFSVEFSKIYQFIGNDIDRLDDNKDGNITWSEVNCFLGLNFDQMGIDLEGKNCKKGDITWAFWEEINSDKSGKDIGILNVKEQEAIAKRVEIENIYLEKTSTSALIAPNVTGLNAAKWRAFVLDYLDNFIKSQGTKKAYVGRNEEFAADVDAVLTEAKYIATVTCCADMQKDECMTQELFQQYGFGNSLPSDLDEIINDFVKSKLEELRDSDPATINETITQGIKEIIDEYTAKTDYTELNKAKLIQDTLLPQALSYAKADGDIKDIAAKLGDDAVSKALKNFLQDFVTPEYYSKGVYSPVQIVQNFKQSNYFKGNEQEQITGLNQTYHNNCADAVTNDIVTNAGIQVTKQVPLIEELEELADRNRLYRDSDNYIILTMSQIISQRIRIGYGSIKEVIESLYKGNEASYNIHTSEGYKKLLNDVIKELGFDENDVITTTNVTNLDSLLRMNIAVYSEFATTSEVCTEITSQLRNTSSEIYGWVMALAEPLKEKFRNGEITKLEFAKQLAIAIGNNGNIINKAVDNVKVRKDEEEKQRKEAITKAMQNGKDILEDMKQKNIFDICGNNTQIDFFITKVNGSRIEFVNGTTQDMYDKLVQKAKERLRGTPAIQKMAECSGMSEDTIIEYMVITAWMATLSIENVNGSGVYGDGYCRTMIQNVISNMQNLLSRIQGDPDNIRSYVTNITTTRAQNMRYSNIPHMWTGADIDYGAGRQDIDGMICFNGSNLDQQWYEMMNHMRNLLINKYKSNTIPEGDIRQLFYFAQQEALDTFNNSRADCTQQSGYNGHTTREDDRFRADMSRISTQVYYCFDKLLAKYLVSGKWW